MRSRVVAIMLLAGITFGLGGMLNQSPSLADDPAVVHVKISGEIDLGLPPFLNRVLRDANRNNVDAIILEIDTPGGRLDAVLQIRDLLLASDIRTVAFVNTTAFSAGALITIAANDILMAPGAVMGAATPVAGDTGETASEKIISAVRSTFRATAVERDRDPRVAEAMVDEAIAIDGVVDAGKLLTLTDREAAAVGYNDGTATNLTDVLTFLDLDTARIETAAIAPAERLARILTGSVIAPLLLSFGLIVLISNVLSGSIGIASILGLTSIGLFLFGHLVAGLAGIEDVLLILAGIILLGIEVLVLPGFGIFGILGVLALLSGATLAMLGRQLEFVETSEIVTTIGTLVLVFVITAAVMIAVITLFGAKKGRDGETRNWARWLGDGGVLDTDTAKTPPELAGAGAYRPPTGSRGVALSDLRPAGVAQFGENRVDVVTSGEYLDRDTPVIVVRSEQFRSVVQKDVSGGTPGNQPPPPPPVS